MTEGSTTLRRYLAAKRDGMTMTSAAVFAPMSIAEARLTEADIAAGRLDHIINQIPAAGNDAAPEPQETNMARGKKADAEQVEVVQKPDFEKMKKIFLGDIKPAEEKTAKARGDLSAAWKAIEDDCHLNKKAAKLLHKLHGESEETRDDFLRTLYGGMKALGLGISRDLVDQMGGEDAPSMPIDNGKGLGLDGLATAH